MTDTRGPTVTRWTPADPAGLAGLLAAYHLRTEAEKGTPVPDPAALPARYRAEVTDPAAAFAADTVLLARDADAPVGCVILVPGGAAELKRLWVDPAARGRGVASALVGAAVDAARETGAGTVRLSVWQWRTPALGLYGRLGFRRVPSWDARDGLVCLERVV